MKMVPTFFFASAIKSRVLVSLSLFWLCGCCTMCPAPCCDPCSVAPSFQPVDPCCDSICCECGQPQESLFEKVRNCFPAHGPFYRFRSRKPFQSRRVIDASSYFSSTRGHHHNKPHLRDCIDECCSAEPSCVAPATCAAPVVHETPSCASPVSCAAPESCGVPEVCVPTPTCATPEVCLDIPDCTAPASCAVPSTCTDSGRYQFPHCTACGSEDEPGYMYEGDIYESDLPAVWNQKEETKAEQKINLPSPKDGKKSGSSTQKSTPRHSTPPKSTPKKVPAPPKKIHQNSGASFVPPLVPPTR